MSTPSHPQRPWRWLMIAGGVAVIAAVSWFAGHSNREVRHIQAQGLASGYDIGAAATPAPTGRLREVQLVARAAIWEIAPAVTIPVVSYNGQVPGPTIRVTEGDTLRVTLTNELDQDTSIHWHGLHVPNAMDGVPPFTQAPIKPGEQFTYEFMVPHRGTFMYHPHVNAVEQIDRGLYGALIIDPATPSPAQFDQDFTMVLSAWDTAALPAGTHAMPGGTPTMGGMAMNYNYFTINGKAFPATETWKVKQGELVRIRLINISNLAHPMHLHGFDFTVIAKDGEPIRPELQQTMNTLSIDAGETYDIVFRADTPGTWLFHCHELHHTENDGVEPGGLIQAIQVGNGTATAPAPAATTATPTPMPNTMPGMGH